MAILLTVALHSFDSCIGKNLLDFFCCTDQSISQRFGAYAIEFTAENFVSERKMVKTATAGLQRIGGSREKIRTTGLQNVAKRKAKIMEDYNDAGPQKQFMQLLPSLAEQI